MKSGQYFALIAAVYLAPQLSARAAWVMVLVCMAISIAFKIGEVA